MPDTTFNSTPPDADDPLRGGTQGGGSPVLVPGSQPGGTNAIQGAGASHVDPARAGSRSPDNRGTRNDVREDPEDAFEGTRHISAAVAKQLARDEVDAGTAPRTPHGASEPRHQDIDAAGEPTHDEPH